jgi:hypothetical protein
VPFALKLVSVMSPPAAIAPAALTTPEIDSRTKSP